MLVDRLKNELSRLTSVKVIKYIASSPLIASGVSKVDLSPILPESKQLNSIAFYLI